MHTAASNEPPRPQSSFAFGPPYGQQTSNMPQSASLGQAPNTRTSTQGLPSGAPAFSASLTTPQKDMARSQSSFSFKRSSFNEKSPNSSPYGPIANSAPYSGGSKSLSGTSFTCDKCGQNYVRISDLLTREVRFPKSCCYS